MRFISSICKYLDIDEICSFSGLEESNVTLFCDCCITNTLRVDLSLSIGYIYRDCCRCVNSHFIQNKCSSIYQQY